MVGEKGKSKRNKKEIEKNRVLVVMSITSSSLVKNKEINFC